MNVSARYCFLVAFLVLLLEIIEMGEPYKLIRPYTYHQRRPLQRPRWYKGHKSSKFHSSKRTPPDDYYSHRPSHYGYGSGDEDFGDNHEGQPYTIVIQLAKGKQVPSNYAERKRKYERDTIPVYSSENDYIDDEEESESRVLNVNDKKVQIRMVKGENPQLQIKISRSDDEKDVEIVDKSNITVMESASVPKIYPDLTTMQQPEESWKIAPLVENIR